MGQWSLCSPEAFQAAQARTPPPPRGGSKGTPCTHVNVQIFGGGRMGLGGGLGIHKELKATNGNVAYTSVFSAVMSF